MAKPIRVRSKQSHRQALETEFHEQLHEAIGRSLHVGRFDLGVKSTYRDGTIASESHAVGDSLVQVWTDGVSLPDKLRALADVLEGTRDDYDGAANIYVLRRFSHEFSRAARTGVRADPLVAECEAKVQAKLARARKRGKR